MLEVQNGTKSQNVELHKKWKHKNVLVASFVCFRVLFFVWFQLKLVLEDFVAHFVSRVSTIDHKKCCQSRKSRSKQWEVGLAA